MGQDKSAGKRYELGLKIQKLEQDMDEFSHEKRQVMEQIDRCQSALASNINKVETLEMELRQQGDWDSVNALLRSQAIQSSVNASTSRQLDIIGQAYNQASYHLENEREAIHRERTALPW